MARSERKPARPKRATGGTTTTPTRMPPASSAATTATAPTDPAPRALALRAARLCLDYKANDVVLLDLHGVTDMTDYFVIASGTSDTHVRSIGERLLDDLRKEGLHAHHIEGLQSGRWVLLDFVDFVVHIFHPTLRTFYQLERLWSDAEVIAVESSRVGA